MTTVRWKCYPLVAQPAPARAWLGPRANLGRAPNTVVACGRAVEEYCRSCAARAVDWPIATREHPSIDCQTSYHTHQQFLQTNALNCSA